MATTGVIFSEYGKANQTGTLNLVNKGPDFEADAENTSQISRKKYESMASRALQLGAAKEKMMESILNSQKMSEVAKKSKKVS